MSRPKGVLEFQNCCRVIGRPDSVKRGEINRQTGNEDNRSEVLRKGSLARGGDKLILLFFRLILGMTKVNSKDMQML